MSQKHDTDQDLVSDPSPLVVQEHMHLEELNQRVQSTPKDDPELPTHLAKLASFLGSQFQDSGHLEKLELALEHYQEAVRLTPAGDPKLALHLMGLAMALTDRYQIMGNLQDIEAAICNYRTALKMTPEDSPHFLIYMQGLALTVGNRYQSTGDPQDIMEALNHLKKVVELTPEDHPDRADRLERLAVAYSTTYEIQGNVNDLEAALLNNHLAVVQTPAGHPNLARCLHSFAMNLCHRYNRFGSLQDIQAAIQHSTKAIKIVPEGHPEHPRLLWGLTISLISRYRRLREVGDLECGMKYNQKAVSLTPDNHPELPVRLKSLAFAYGIEYSRSEDLRALNAALDNYRSALALFPKAHPFVAECLQNMAVQHTLRYFRLRDLNDIKAALICDNEAVQCTPEDNPGLPGHLHSLAVSYANAFTAFNDFYYLDAAMQNYELTVRTTPKEHPELPRRLQSLASLLTQRFNILHNPIDLDVALANYKQSFFEKTTSEPVRSWNAALDWAALAYKYRPEESLMAYSSAFNILPDILWAGMSHINCSAAAQRIDLVKTTSDAAHTCIELASENVQEIAIERNKLLEEICARPGFGYFLRLKPYKDICKAARDGPIIILNAMRFNVIVLLNPESDPLHVPLPGVTFERLKDQKSVFKDLLNSSRLFGMQESFTSKSSKEVFEYILSWLWIHIVDPIYKVLELHNILHGRLWWCPTGDFTGLPLHAAPSSDQFVHSYTSHLGVLIRSNSKQVSGSPGITIVGVTHINARGHADLPGVEQEVMRVSAIVGQHVQLLTGEDATVVTSQIQDCSGIHLACHGQQDLCDPPKSCLQLYEGILDLGTILHMPLSNAEFVFLAACWQTAMKDTGMANDSFHLGGGLIAAGFQGEVGTMWSILDADGPTIAGAFYPHLFVDQKKPQASSEAARAL
ncbi:CHAT domain-containing protein [Mycena rebaudengoi]|nr:CHAT domain-containing protein [Mycena rebaudengoi]